MSSLLSSLFICSFSSIFSALLLIFSTLWVVVVMYWNMISTIPIYLLSLFMLGGLYVLIGFVMMADESDLDMVLSGVKVKEYLVSFLGVLIGLSLNKNLISDLSLDSVDFSPMKVGDWSTWGILSGVFFFLVVVLFLFLFILHGLMKSSGGGGFMK